jgi:hypothetical protein
VEPSARRNANSALSSTTPYEALHIDDCCLNRNKAGPCMSKQVILRDTDMSEPQIIDEIKLKVEIARKILRSAEKRSEVSLSDVGITVSGTVQVPGV